MRNFLLQIVDLVCPNTILSVSNKNLKNPILIIRISIEMQSVPLKYVSLISVNQLPK